MYLSTLYRYSIFRLIHYIQTDKLAQFEDSKKNHDSTFPLKSFFNIYMWLVPKNCTSLQD